MEAEFGSHDWRDRKVRDYLLLLLRFAVTREATDQVAALALAEQLDSLGSGGNGRNRVFSSKRVSKSPTQYSQFVMGKTTLCSEGTSRASMTLD